MSIFWDPFFGIFWDHRKSRNSIMMSIFLGPFLWEFLGPSHVMQFHHDVKFFWGPFWDFFQPSHVMQLYHDDEQIFSLQGDTVFYPTLIDDFC